MVHFSMRGKIEKNRPSAMRLGRLGRSRVSAFLVSLGKDAVGILIV